MRFDLQGIFSFVLDIAGLATIVALAYWKLVSAETVTALFGVVFGGRAAMRGARLMQQGPASGGFPRVGGSAAPPGASGGPPPMAGFTILLAVAAWRLMKGG